MPRGDRFEAVVRSDVEPLPAVCGARRARTLPAVEPLGLDLLHVVFNAAGERLVRFMLGGWDKHSSERGGKALGQYTGNTDIRFFSASLQDGTLYNPRAILK